MAISDKKFNKLLKSIEYSQRALAFARAKRVSAVKQFVGSHYSDGGAENNVPVSVLKLAIDIYVRALAPRAPRVLVTTINRWMKPKAANLELALNLIPGEIRLDATLRRVVTEALFSLGIVKVGLHTVGTALGHEYGESFVDVVTIDDYFMDMAAKSMDLIQYEGNDYWPVLEDLLESDRFKKGKLNGLEHDEDSFLGEAGEERADGVSRDGTAESYKDRVWLRDVWVPDEGLLHTYAVKSKRLLGTVEWDGPERGPYPKLSFSDVPGNLLPLPPVSVWRDLHELSNALFRKLGRQADSQKNVLGFSGKNDDEVNDFKAAADGDGIHYTGPDPKRLTAGGVSPNTMSFYQMCRELSSYFGGNLDALGGLAPMTETVGQDKLLTESASAQMRDMSGRTVDFVRKIFGDLAHYEWTDPIRTRTLEKPIPGMGGSAIPVEWNSEARDGDFSEFDLDIDVYSLQDDSPGLKLQRLGYIMSTYVLPLLPEIQRQGGQLDAQKIIELVAKYSDFAELSDIVTFVEQGPQAAQQPAGQPPAPGGGGQPGAPQGAAGPILQPGPAMEPEFEGAS